MRRQNAPLLPLPITVQFSIVHAQNSSRYSQATGSSNLREFRGNQTCENYLRTTLVELLFCFSALLPLVLSILAAKFSRIVFFRRVFLCYQLLFCLFCGEHIFRHSCAQSEKWNSPTTLRRSDAWNKLVAVVSRLCFKLMLWMNIDKTVVRKIIYRKILFENP